MTGRPEWQAGATKATNTSPRLHNPQMEPKTVKFYCELGAGVNVATVPGPRYIVSDIGSSAALERGSEPLLLLACALLWGTRAPGQKGKRMSEMPHAGWTTGDPTARGTGVSSAALRQLSQTELVPTPLLPFTAV